MREIRLFKPDLGEEELSSIRDSFSSSWIGLGPKVTEFEEQWLKMLGCREAVAVNSCTAALHLAVSCFEFPKGKKILVPSQTFSATASAILYNNLIPVFVDSNPKTLSLSLEDLKLKYDKDCVAVMPVHYAGHPVEMDQLVPWAKSKNLKVIEDCAHTIKSKYKGKYLGTWGDMGCYSFEEKKLMTTGDGGMMVTNDSSIFKNLKAMRWVGIDKDNWKTAKSYTQANHDAMHWFYEISILGYKYNMNDLSASIGLVQLKKLDEMNKHRAQIISKYMEGIKNLKNVSPLLPFNPEIYNYQMFGIRTPHRDELIVHLKSKGIATGCHYTPLTMQPLFKNYPGDCPVIEEIYPEMITLPLHTGLTINDVNYIINQIKTFELQFN